MSEQEKISNTIGNLLFNRGKNASANYNHVNNLAKRLRYLEEHVPFKKGNKE